MKTLVNVKACILLCISLLIVSCETEKEVISKEEIKTTDLGNIQESPGASNVIFSKHYSPDMTLEEVKADFKKQVADRKAKQPRRLGPGTEGSDTWYATVYTYTGLNERDTTDAKVEVIIRFNSNEGLAITDYLRLYKFGETFQGGWDIFYVTLQTNKTAIEGGGAVKVKWLDIDSAQLFVDSPTADGWGLQAFSCVLDGDEQYPRAVEATYLSNNNYVYLSDASGFTVHTVSDNNTERIFVR